MALETYGRAGRHPPAEHRPQLKALLAKLCRRRAGLHAGRDPGRKGVPVQEVHVDLRRRRLGLRHRLRRLDHVLASGEDVNIFVFDTEVYSNTGGQSSKATPSARWPVRRRRQEIQEEEPLRDRHDLRLRLCRTGGHGRHQPAQTLKAITEAEAYHGPSLIIGYAPCEMHSIKGGMGNCQKEMKKAVDCGYWNLFRYNPAAEPGKKFTLDSKEPPAAIRSS